DAEDEMFLISVNSEEKIVSSYAYGSFFKLLFGGILANACPLAALATGKPDFGAALGAAWPSMLLAAYVYATAIIIYYLFLLYNGLVSVRHHLPNARSLIDIHPKRRFHLIPN